MLRRLLAAALGLCVATTCFGADTLVLCPAGWRAEFGEWATLRAAQGHTLSLATASRSVEGNQRRIRAANADGRLRCVVLVGDVATPGAPPCGYEPLQVIARWGHEKTVATDHVYADLVGDAAPELAVGRIPCNNLKELRRYLRRVVAYEKRRPGEPSQTTATAAKPLRVVAAPGRFSPLVDRMLEAAATRVLTELTPAGTPLDVTYALPGSPHYPGADRLHATVAAGLTQPAVAWVYLGHGLARSLDAADSPSGPRPLLTTADVANLTGNSGPPVAALFACYTGAVDARRGCLAEQLIAQRSGPLNVIAASRVTMPYGNAVLGVELLRGLFDSSSTNGDFEHLSLGNLVRQAKQRCLAPPESDPLRAPLESIAAGIMGEIDRSRERIEHLYAYNLLGDPLLTVRPPGKQASARLTQKRDPPPRR